MAETRSPAAKIPKCRLRVIRALGTAKPPPRARITDSAASTGDRFGCENPRAIIPEKKETNTVKPIPIPSDSQKTVDSSCHEGLGCLMIALPMPASHSMLASSMNGIARPRRPKASGPRIRARMGRTSSCNPSRTALTVLSAIVPKKARFSFMLDFRAAPWVLLGGSSRVCWTLSCPLIPRHAEPRLAAFSVNVTRSGRFRSRRATGSREAARCGASDRQTALSLTLEGRKSHDASLIFQDGKGDVAPNRPEQFSAILVWAKLSIGGTHYETAAAAVQRRERRAKSAARGGCLEHARSEASCSGLHSRLAVAQPR